MCRNNGTQSQRQMNTTGEVGTMGTSPWEWNRWEWNRWEPARGNGTDGKGTRVRNIYVNPMGTVQQNMGNQNKTLRQLSRRV